MSARRLFAALAVAVAAALTAAAPARAQDSIVVQVGGELAAPAGQYVNIPVTVDLSAAPGRSLGGYQITLRFDPLVLLYQQTTTGSFATPVVNTDSVGTTGRVLYAALQPSGATGRVLVFTVQFYVVTDTVLSPVTVSVGQMTASAGSSTPFEDLLPLVRVVSGNFCGTVGIWGDVDGDSASNSRDALMALSAVVGLPPAVGTTPGLADVDADGAVTSRDALIILSHAVGLPVTGFRVMLTATSPACATGAATRIVVTPDTLDLATLQQAQVTVTALDAAGRAVPATNVRWRAVDPSVAGHNGYEVVGHGPGTTRLIAELGAGAADTLTVIVVARRSTWYVDVRRARNVVTQTGSLRHPMEFIGDAVGAAQDGDTVRVAGGIYEEVVSASRSVTILGDSLDRPVIDPRAAPFWNPCCYRALELNGSAQPQVLAHVVIRAGGAELEGGDVTVRWVHVDTAVTALRLRALPDYTNPAPGLGQLGNVLVDSVSVGHFTAFGIEVEEADTAEVRNSRISGMLIDSEGCSSGSSSDPGNIVIIDATRGWVHDNVVDGGPCQGIGVFASAGRAVIQRNLVRNIAVNGIVARARYVALDHNAVRTFGRDPSSNYYEGHRGIWIARDPCYYCGTLVVPDSVVSVADTVVDLYGASSVGFNVDTALVTVIDQLRTDSIGVDSSFTADGIAFGGLRLVLTNSRIFRSGGDGLRASGTVDVFSRGNRWHEADRAIRAEANFQHMPDTVVVVGDSMTGMRTSGPTIFQAQYARVDSAYVDGTGATGVYLSSVDSAVVARTTIRSGGTGVYAGSVGALSLLADSIQNGSTGVLMSNGADTARISRSVITGHSGHGLDFDGQAVRLDSTIVSGNAGSGLMVQGGSGFLARYARIEANGIGVFLTAGTRPLSVIRQSRIAGNLLQQGARNDNSPNSTLDADSVWWGDPAGPNCPAIVGSCSTTGADSVLTQGIVFADFLTATPPTPAPPALRPVAPRAAGAAPVSSSRRPPASSAALRSERPPEGRTVGRGSPRAAEGDRPRLSWQRGREPRPPSPPRDR